jgi:hypothetical protein
MVAWSRAYRAITPPTNLGDSPNTVDSLPTPERNVSPRNASIAIDAPTGRKGYVEIFNGVCRYLKVAGPGCHHPFRGRIYMYDDAASRKSGNRTAYEDSVVTSPTQTLAKDEAGSPKLGASTLARKLDSVEVRECKLN